MFDASPDPSADDILPIDPAIEVCERHLRLLREVGEVAMEVTRALGAAAVAAAGAVEEILSDKMWQPETSRARALAGAKDAAEAFHKAARALRLTLALEKATAETLRDLRAGVAPAPKDRAVGPSARPGAAPDPLRAPLRETVREIVAEVIAEDGDIDTAPDLAGDLRERLTENDRFGPLLRRPLIEVVGLICADIGVTPDWSRWTEDGRRDPPPTLPPSLPRSGEGQTARSDVRVGNGEVGEISKASPYPTLTASPSVPPNKGEGGEGRPSPQPSP